MSINFAPSFGLCLLLLSLTVGTAVAGDESRLTLGHSKTIAFRGSPTSEDAEINPFTNYRLLVHFRHSQSHRVVRGFYAADGNAAETGATSGGVWKVRFAPDRVGRWTYTAQLRRGEQIAIDDRPESGEVVPLENASGSFEVLD